MKYTAQINVMPHKNLLDPQGKAVLGGIHSMGMAQVEDVRIGKRISLNIEAENEAKAMEIAENASKKLLANAVMEFFEITIEKA